MRARIKELAASNHRSMNAEILAALEMWLDQSQIGMDKAEFYQMLRESTEEHIALYGENFPEVAIRVDGRIIDYVPHPKHLTSPKE